METPRRFKPTLISLIASIWLVSSCFSILHAEKRALIVAVGDYPENSGWNKINAVNDADLIRAALISQGFQEKNITVMINSEATRAGILDAIKNQLIDAAGRGDVVYFHFSGHGQQVADNNGDETDRYDEAIVPYDSPISYKAGVYEGENLIRDEELGKLFIEIRRKIGPTGQMITVLDACHSGTGTRGMGVARGTDKRMADSSWVANSGSRGSVQGEAQFDEAGGEQLAPYVAFFGAAHNQLNFETEDQQGRRVGSLSYSFSKYFSQAGPESTYRGLFSQIRQEMAVKVPRQTPQAEGGLDRKVMGGNVIEQPAFYLVQDVLPGNQVVLNGGWLQGLTNGSLLGIFPPETREYQKVMPLTTGEVLGASALQCTLLLKDPVDPNEIRQTWAILMEQDPGSLRLNVNFAMPEGALKNQLINRYTEEKVIALEEPYDLTVQQQGTILKVYSSDEMEIGQITVNQNFDRTYYQLSKIIKQAGQAKFLRTLEASSPELKVEMEVIPVITDDQGRVSKKVPIEEFQGPDGLIRIPEGTEIKFRVINKGSKPAYFSIIEIYPTNEARSAIPDQDNVNETATEYRIPAGESWELPQIWEMYEPYGREFFKLLATSEPVDLRPILINKGASNRAMPTESSPLEILMNDSFYTDDVKTRGGRLKRIPSGSLGVSTLDFIITPNN